MARRGNFAVVLRDLPHSRPQWHAQPIAGASTVTSTSAPINNVIFPCEPPLTPQHAQSHHTPPPTRHIPGKHAHITVHATAPHNRIRQMSPVLSPRPWHNSDLSMDIEAGIIQPQCLFAGCRHIGAVSSDGPDDVFSTPRHNTPVISPALSDASLPPSSELSSPPRYHSETPPLWFPDSPTAIVTSSPVAPEPFIPHFSPSPSPQPSPVPPPPLLPSPSPPPSTCSSISCTANLTTCTCKDCGWRVTFIGS
ncbi:hypothetical protein M422DRAFT_249258 [Sphaerobolus stellatus SS14]|uniref:Uncharacterized protein n=1 Tax=Sphaerobolus stellatus (strain SS14) TaxID=990650 RepID=A0A0C9VV89_SPHS4|nr:hypothetical protein M422DRAFT_249258 [Sphaerobolus stellatus SS14]